VVTFGLIMWFTFETNGGELGLAERCAAVAPALWLFPVASGARRAFVRGDVVECDSVAHVKVGPGRFVDLDRRHELECLPVRYEAWSSKM
jgi:hypothetical protein